MATAAMVMPLMWIKPLRLISEFLYPSWLHSCKLLPSVLSSLSLNIFSTCGIAVQNENQQDYKCV